MVVLLAFIRYEGKRIGMTMSLCWVPILGTITVGVSLGLSNLNYENCIWNRRELNTLS
ncbi:DUF2834 domain-containing protein [Paenibacillus alvei]|uniref:Uncharacterized protein n=1 Tax=Paenibacillus alvei TaxID=44250 RepID=A0A383R7W1_PAEAL|nr:DUF2834 domain-containing protein [Paenibacillus alvei]SYX83195.1 protein of unknown function [Paenibacillus alvei]